MEIRRAVLFELDAIYQLGLTTPEFRVSADHPFMTKEELYAALIHLDSHFWVAHDGGNIRGFLYARLGDIDATSTRWACVVYLVVHPDYRQHGIAGMIYQACEKELVSLGVTHVYGWADPDSPIVSFMKKQGFTPGKQCLWMDKEIRKS